MTGFCATWENLYPSSTTRFKVRERLRSFLRCGFEAKRLERIPAIPKIKVEEPAILSLTTDEYKRLLNAVHGQVSDRAQADRVHAFFQLMRWIGLAIQDALTLECQEFRHDAAKNLYRIVTDRGYEVVREYTDRISGGRARRPGLDEMMANTRRGWFDVVPVWASDRIARSVKHFLDVLDELNRLNIEFVSFREQIDTGGPLGRAIVVIIGAIAELERNLIVERVKAGMRRARLESRHIGQKPLDIDREAIVRDRQRGLSQGQLARAHGASRATIHRVIREQMPADRTVSKGL